MIAPKWSWTRARPEFTAFTETICVDPPQYGEAGRLLGAAEVKAAFDALGVGPDESESAVTTTPGGG